MGYDVDPARCAVLVPVSRYVEPECERRLAELEHRGYAVRRAYGYAGIDQVRSHMATEALADGFDELMWVDADVVFDPDAVLRLRRRNLPLVAGIYPKKNAQALACRPLPETRTIRFGGGGGLCELRYAATGFLHTRREVYEKIAVHEQLPVCNQRFSAPVVPYFLPMVHTDEEGDWYLAEDYSFCERARRTGFSIMADTSIRLDHVGSYTFSWEEAGTPRERFATYDLNIRT